jgi:hypothetical protein
MKSFDRSRYDTRLDIKFQALELIDEKAFSDAVRHPWFNRTLCAVSAAAKWPMGHASPLRGTAYRGPARHRSRAAESAMRFGSPLRVRHNNRRSRPMIASELWLPNFANRKTSTALPFCR